MLVTEKFCLNVISQMSLESQNIATKRNVYVRQKYTMNAMILFSIFLHTQKINNIILFHFSEYNMKMCEVLYISSLSLQFCCHNGYKQLSLVEKDILYKYYLSSDKCNTYMLFYYKQNI